MTQPFTLSLYTSSVLKSLSEMLSWSLMLRPNKSGPNPVTRVWITTERKAEGKSLLKFGLISHDTLFQWFSVHPPNICHFVPLLLSVSSRSNSKHMPGLRGLRKVRTRIYPGLINHNMSAVFITTVKGYNSSIKVYPWHVGCVYNVC